MSEVASRRLQQLLHGIQHGSVAQQQAAMQQLLDMAGGTRRSSSPQDTARAKATRLAILQQPSALPALQQLLQMQGKALPGMAAMLLLLLAAAGEQAAQQIATHPGLLPALAHLLQPSSLDSPGTDFAVRTCYSLTAHSVAAQHLAADPAAIAGLLRMLRAASMGESRTDITAAGAETVCKVAVTLHRLAALPCSSVPPLQQPSIIAAPAALLHSRHDWEVRQVALEALNAMLNPVPVHAGQRAARQLAALPDSCQDVVQLLASTPAANEAQADLAVYVVRRLVDQGSCSAAAIARQLAADRAAVAAVVRSVVCKNEERRILASEVFMALVPGEWGCCSPLWRMRAACRACGLRKCLLGGAR